MKKISKKSLAENNSLWGFTGQINRLWYAVNNLIILSFLTSLLFALFLLGFKSLLLIVIVNVLKVLVLLINYGLTQRRVNHILGRTDDNICGLVVMIVLNILLLLGKVGFWFSLPIYAGLFFLPNVVKPDSKRS